MWCYPQFHLFLETPPKATVYFLIFSLDIRPHGFPIAKVVEKFPVGQGGKHFDEIRPWSTERCESFENTINLSNVLTVPFISVPQYQYDGQWEVTNGDTSTVGHLHDDTRRVTTIVHVKICGIIKKINAKLLGFVMLNRDVRFGHLWSEKLHLSAPHKSSRLLYE